MTELLPRPLFQNSPQNSSLSPKASVLFWSLDTLFSASNIPKWLPAHIGDNPLWDLALSSPLTPNLSHNPSFPEIHLPVAPSTELADSFPRTSAYVLAASRALSYRAPSVGTRDIPLHTPEAPHYHVAPFYCLYRIALSLRHACFLTCLPVIWIQAK